MSAAPMNAKERRKLLRLQQQQQEEAASAVPVKEEPVMKAEEAAPVKSKKKVVKKEVKAEPTSQSADSSAMNAKDRRKLQRQAAHSTEGEDKEADQTAEATTKAEPSAEAVDASGLNSKQRRLLQRQAARSAEGGDKDVAKKAKAKTEPNSGKKRKLKASKNDEVDENGMPKKKVKSIHLTLFVGQLPYSATRETIKKHFRESGEIEVRMMTDKKTNKFKGTAFIEVRDSKALGAALSRHHTLFNGRRINVELTASGGGNKSEQRRTKIDLLRKKQSNVQIEKTKALVQKHVDNPACKLTQEDVDERMLDFLSWFDYETAKKSLEEFNRCVSDRVMNRKAFFMGILKRFRETDGVE